MTASTKDIMKLGLRLVGWNSVPFDSAIHIEGNNIKKVLMAIDVSTAELLIAKHIGCDAVIAHHPIGTSSLGFHRVFNRQVEFMTQYGVPENAARSAMNKLKSRTQIRSHANIYKQIVDAARILKMPLVNIHQPCDEYMRRIILKKVRQCKKDHRVSDLIKLLEEIPEFSNAETRPLVTLGSMKNMLGKVALVLAAGTNGGYQIAKLYYEHDVSTVIYLHIDPGEAAKLKAEKVLGNLVILGHLAGDSIGFNALADNLERIGVGTVRMGIISASNRK